MLLFIGVHFPFSSFPPRKDGITVTASIIGVMQFSLKISRQTHLNTQFQETSQLVAMPQLNRGINGYYWNDANESLPSPIFKIESEQFKCA
jgi:hypothetical protein